MLDQLVESRSNAGDNTRRGSFLLTTLVVMVSILLSAYLYSLFAKNFDLSGSDLSLETLVAPPIIEEAPEPEPQKQPERQKDPNVDLRKELIQNILSSPVKPPETVSTTQNKIKAMREGVLTKIGNMNTDAINALPEGHKGPVNTGGTGSDSGNKGGGGDDETGKDAPPPPPKAVPKQISGGVLNGKATSLPKPPYPPAARAVRAAGPVTVQVLIDENGNVVSASAVSGHPLLRAAAASAARGAKFSPTKLSGQAVKVSGVITYNFVAP